MPELRSSSSIATNFLRTACLGRSDAYCSWPPNAGSDAVAAVLEWSAFHGLQPTLFEALAGRQDVPESLLSALRHEVLERAAWELRDRELNTRVVAALAAAGIEVLVFKGAALAYSLYPNPVLRSRTDTDLLVREAQRLAAQQVLADHGLMAAPGAEAVIVHQNNHALMAREGGVHNIDLHWRLNNAQSIAAAFTFDELLSRSTPLPALGSSARAVGSVDALLIACFHRRVHARYTAERAIWLRDIDLLVRRMDSADAEPFLVSAGEKGLSRTCLDALLATALWWQTPCSDDFLTTLASQAIGRLDRYFEAGGLRRMVMDMIACRDSNEALTYVGRQLFPPRAYMEHKFQGTRLAWLPLLHARRLAGGLLRRRQRHGSIR